MALSLTNACLLLSRYLAEQFPSAGKVMGIDLSPHMLLTGRHMQEEEKVGWSPPGGGATHPRVCMFGDPRVVPSVGAAALSVVFLS